MSARGTADDGVDALSESVGISLWIAIVLVSAFLAGGLIDIRDRSPRIGRVRLDDLAAEYVGQVSRVDALEADVATSARAWAVELERALHRVAERHGVVLLPAEVVAAGAPDYTGEVRSAMQGWAFAAGGGQAGRPAQARRTYREDGRDRTREPHPGVVRSARGGVAAARLPGPRQRQLVGRRLGVFRGAGRHAAIGRPCGVRTARERPARPHPTSKPCGGCRARGSPWTNTVTSGWTDVRMGSREPDRPRPGQRPAPAPGGATQVPSVPRGIHGEVRKIIMRAWGDDTVRGGQTVFHGLRMWSQLVRVVLLVIVGLVVAVPGFSLWRSTTGDDWYGVGMVDARRNQTRLRLSTGVRSDGAPGDR